MSWIANMRTVADPTGATVSAIPTFDGARILIEVAFRLTEWPSDEKGPVSLLPQPAEVTARTRHGNVLAGDAVPAPEHVIVPPSHSSDSKVRYVLTLSNAALDALETTRDGGELDFDMILVAHPFGRGFAVNATIERYSFRVPRDQWTAALQNAGYCKTLVTELKLPTTGPDSTAESCKRLVSAIEARNNGSYAEAMRRCRLAIDELKKAGFGGKAPADVAKFLQEKSGTMSQSERFSALQVALWVFLSSAHHVNAPEDEYSREDAELAIAMVAALLRLAPRWDMKQAPEMVDHNPNGRDTGNGRL